MMDAERSHPAHVLIVDDDRFLAETLAEILSQEALEVEICGTGAEALDAVRRHPHGIALVDVRLPDIGGTELLQKLRETAPDLDIVIVTGNASVHSAIEALNQGASRYVLKPCAPDELLSIMRDLLERRHLRERNRLYLRRLEIQNRLSEALSSAIGPEEVGQAAVKAIRSLTEVRAAALLAFEGEARVLRPLAWAGMEPGTASLLAAMPEVLEFDRLDRVSPEPLPGMVRIQGDEMIGEPGTFCPVALYRLRGRERSLGLLAVVIHCGSEADPQNEDLLIAIANWVGVALERAMLHRRLETAFSELKTAQRRLIQAEKLSAIGRLAAGLAHEVGTPLNIISGRAEFLLEEAGTNREVSQGLRVIVQQIERISSLIRQLLDFSREQTVVRRRVNLTEVLGAVLPLLEVPLSKRRIRLEVRVPEDLPPVLADWNQLQQVFINLLMNSMDAIASRTSAAAPGGHIVIDVEGTPADPEVRITVQDDGQGIREEHLDKVFEPFFSTKDVGTGTGLGLAVVYGIVTEHGGTIDISSTWGTGTTVVFTLPTDAASRATNANPS